jgi:hypothetical protein
MSNSSFNPSDMIRLAQSILDAKTNAHELMLEDVHSITRRAYEQYPEDPVITQVAFTIERMAEKAPTGSTITKGEISSIYNNFVGLSSSSKFRDVLGQLLPFDLPNQNKQPDYSRLNQIDTGASHIDMASLVDQNVVTAISSGFVDKLDTTKLLDPKLVQQGKEFIAAELKAQGGLSALLDVLGGNNTNMIVYAAGFDTSKGLVKVAIPVAIQNGCATFPNSFLVDDHLEALTAANLQKFIDLKPELDNLKIAHQTNRPEIDARQNVKMPTELAHLACDFENDVIEAASVFGLETIRNGKEMIARELKGAGFKNAQVKFGSESNSSVVYLALINTPKGPTEIEVPVEMKALAGDKYAPLAPSYFAYDGLIEDFTAAKLQRFATRLPVAASGSMTYSSAMKYMVLPELKDEIIKAASENDYVTCEEALQEIQARYPEEDFKNALSDYHYVLTQKTASENKVEHKCSRVILAGHGSISDRCGHLLRPLDEVVTDEYGNCRLKTAVERERLNPIEDSGACMSSSKIYLT